MRAEILAVGSELVSGRSLDTNSQWLSRALGELGIPVAFHTSLGDEIDDNLAAFRAAAARVELVIVSGGLGPTQDDLTRDVLAQVADVPLREDPASLEAIRGLFARRDRPMADRNRVQALFPEGSEPLPNAIGTAPGIWMELGPATFACLPGVPIELRRMFEEQVAPRLRRLRPEARVIVERKINLFGRGESEVESLVLDLTARGRVPEVGITAHEATISLRIRGEGTTREDALVQTGPTAAIIYERFGELVVGEADVDVPEAVARELERTGLSLATAESCTGGLIAHLLTLRPGASAYFPGGVVSYANEAKARFLGVPEALLAAHGAVSPEVAAVMAAGARDGFGTDLAIATTGVAGPTGGTAEKPVGLVYLGLATPSGVETRRLELGPEQPREIMQRRAAKMALNWVRLALRTLPE